MLTAVVTGAGEGIGLEVCRQLPGHGMDVVLTARTEAGVEAGLDALDRPDGLSGAVMDVSDEGSVAAALGAREVDVLVNNAGRIYGGYGGGFADAEPETILAAIDNNALGALRTIRAVLPGMNARGCGRIVNVSSGMGGLTEMGGGALPYRFSKVALNAVTRLAHAEAGQGVKVNSVCPGWVRTAMGGPSANRTVERGASGVVWAATLGGDGPSGGFFRDGRAIAW